MIAARIGPIGNVKLPSADAVVAEAVGSEVSCATEVFSTSAGWPVVALTATAARRGAPRPSRPVVAAVISVCGSAAEPLPVPDETTDATGRAFTPLTEPAAAGNGRVMAVLEPREVGPRDTPRAADGGADDPADAAPEPAPDPAEAAESAVSANATAVEANSEPMPRATASAPTRPTCRTRLDAPRRRADSVMPVGYAFTDHRLL